MRRRCVYEREGESSGLTHKTLSVSVRCFRTYMLGRGSLREVRGNVVGVPRVQVYRRDFGKIWDVQFDTY